MSGNLADACRFDDRGPALAFRKTRGLIAVGIDTAELLAIGVIDSDEPVVMLAPPVLAKSSFFLASVLFRHSFIHCQYPCTGKALRHYRRETKRAQVPSQMVTCALYITRGSEDNRGFASARARIAPTMGWTVVKPARKLAAKNAPGGQVFASKQCKRLESPQRNVAGAGQRKLFAGKSCRP